MADLKPDCPNHGHTKSLSTQNVVFIKNCIGKDKIGVLSKSSTKLQVKYQLVFLENRQKLDKTAEKNES